MPGVLPDPRRKESPRSGDLRRSSVWGQPIHGRSLGTKCDGQRWSAMSTSRQLLAGGGKLAPMSAPVLPDGLVVVVKEDCATCRMVAPLLPELDATVYTQDNPAFPDGSSPIHDHDLTISWHHDIETVPTLIHVVDGAEVERTVGWLREDWRRI